MRTEFFGSAKMLQPGMPAPEIKAQAFLPNGTFKEVSLGDYKVIRGPLLTKVHSSVMGLLLAWLLGICA